MNLVRYGGGSEQTCNRTTVSIHHFIYSFPLAAVYGWGNGWRKGQLFYHVLWQSELLFPLKCYETGFSNTAHILLLHEEAATEFVLLNLLPLC